MNYLIDAYTIFAASVLAANAVMRSIFGAVFPLFTTQMYDNLGIHWASTVPAFLALACVPFPFLFYKYGATIRVKCKYAQQADAFLKKMQNEMQQDDSDDASDDEAKPVNSNAAASDADTAVGSHSEAHEEKEHAKELRREEEEQEAIDYSYEPEEDREAGGRFQKIRTSQSQRRPAGARRGTSYEGNPFDLDRVNTRESFKRKGSTAGSGLSRSSSRTSRR